MALASSLHLSTGGPLYIRDESSDDDNTSEFEDGSEPEFNELKPKLHHLGLYRSYVPCWGKQEAFREFYQNWKDAIIASFNPPDFKPKIKETKTEIRITVHRDHVSKTGNVSKELLGFIRFKEKSGSVEFTNFKAHLQLKHLGMGESSKVGREEFAGVHGEGLKLAALVMRRERHSVKITSSRYYWNFAFRGSMLCCKLAPAAESVVKRQRDRYAGKTNAEGIRTELNANIWEDVKVRIGKMKKQPNTGISKTEFCAWLKISIDLQDLAAANIVYTSDGDLILDPRFSGQIYLKGLRVSGHGSNGRDYIFAYNFLRGSINRDRQRLSNPSEEAEMVARIWDNSIRAKGDAMGDITDAYIQLFHTHEDCADIAFAAEKLPLSMAKAIWSRLRSSWPNAFFYSEGDNLDSGTLDQAKIITSDLNKQPRPVPKALWKVLRARETLRVLSPHEERIRLFMDADQIDIPQTPFCVSIVRALRASLSLHCRLQGVDIQLVKGGDVDINLLFDKEKNILRIHEKWINFQDIHLITNCDVSSLIGDRSNEKEAFFCDHVAEGLVELAIDEIGSQLGLNMAECLETRRQACARIRQVPRLIKVQTTAQVNELEVSWTGNESGIISKEYAPNIHFLVTLHAASTCGTKRHDLVWQTDTPRHASSPSPPVQLSCNCSAQTISLAVSKAIFTGLNHQDEYFPMVSRVEKGSFFGIPPASVAPEAVTRFSSTSFGGVRILSTLETPDLASNNVDMSLYTNSPDISFAESDEEDTSEGPLESCSRGGKVTTPGTLSSRAEARSPSPMAEDPQEVNKEALLNFNRDANEWHSWYDEKMGQVFSQFLPWRETKDPSPSFNVSGFECGRLHYAFELDEFVRVRISAASLPVEDLREYVIFIHDIGFYVEDNSGARTYYLKVNKYSMLASTYPFHEAGRRVGTSDQEFLLYFGELDKVGTREDTEIIYIRDICFAEDFPFNIAHVPQVPQDFNNCGPFCRFGIRYTDDNQDACITPIAFNLPQSRGRGRKFNGCLPLVFDCSPQVLGPSEGFSQAGFGIRAALGFDQEEDVTWKIRHHSSQVYDGPPSDIFDDFASVLIQPPTAPRLQPPKVVVVAREHQVFRLNNSNEWMPSIEEFLEPLDVVDTAIKSSLRPDFMVSLLAPALLHPSTGDRFATSILRLLEHGLSVHIKLSSLCGHNSCKHRSVLIVVASPYCDALPWNADGSIIGTEPSASDNDPIRDLVFENPRVLADKKMGFVCSRPAQNGSRDQENGLARMIYNHQTGRQLETDGISLGKLATSFFALCNNLRSRTHEIRKDHLTVRELARYQGFPDDFVFYGSMKLQFENVCSALSPAVAKMTGETLLRVIRSWTKATVDAQWTNGSTMDGNVDQRSNKRPRQDDQGRAS